MVKRVFYKDYDGRTYVEESQLKQLSDWIKEGPTFYKKNDLEHIIIRIIKRSSGYIITVKKLVEVNEDLFAYKVFKMNNLLSVEEAKFRSEMLAKEFGYKQDITLGI